jgi:glutaredoxin 3
MFAARRSSILVARGVSTTATTATTAFRRNTAQPSPSSLTNTGREFRLLSTLWLPASLGTTIHVCSLERDSISMNSNTLAAYSNNAATAKKKGWLSRFMSSSSSSAPTTLSEEVSNLVDNHKVVIFSKSYCPYCSATKKLFGRMKLDDMVVIELDRDPRGADIQHELQRLTGQRTVPNVFVNGTHLGGNSDAQAAAQNGKLQEMLK